METLQLILWITGIFTGILLWDLRTRSQDRKALKKATAEAEKAAQALSELHNKQISQLKAISDKVDGHEMFLKTAAQTTNNNVMKRF